MKKQLLLILISAGISIQQSFCQTVLAPGKIAFLGFQSGQSGQQALDRFAFVLLQDVAAGTQIHFTDNAVLDQVAENEEETPNLSEETGDYEAESNKEDAAPESPAE